MNNKINSLLTTEAPIKLLIPDIDEVVTLKKYIKSHYKIIASGQLTPLKLKVIFHSTNVNLNFYLSRVVERPNKGEYEKIMTVQGKASCLSYKSGNEKRFSDGCVYFTIEAESECCFLLKAGFGDVYFRRTNASEVISRDILTPKGLHKDDSLSFLLTRPRTIRLHIKRTKKPLILIKKHRKEMIWRSEEKDNEERIKKFISSHRIELKKKLIEVAKRKLKDLNELKSLIMVWVHIIKTIQIAKWSFNKLDNYKKRKTENEKRIFKAIKIYIFLRVHVTFDSLEYKSRLHSKISA